MRHSPLRLLSKLVGVTALGASLLLVTAGGCTESTCEGNCLDEYDDCLARSPPGASKSDCSAAYDNCLKYCSAVSDTPEDTSAP